MVTKTPFITITLNRKRLLIFVRLICCPPPPATPFQKSHDCLPFLFLDTFSTLAWFRNEKRRFISFIRSGQVWEHAPEQRVAASTFRRYSRGLRLAFPQADASPSPSPGDADQPAATTRHVVGPLASSTHDIITKGSKHHENEAGLLAMIN